MIDIAPFIPVIGGVAGVGVVATILANGYVKASPDEALVITGLSKTPKTIVGQSSLKIPFFQRVDRIPLTLICIDFKTKDRVPTKDFIDVSVDAVANVKVSNDPEKLKLAAQHFLGKSVEEISDTVQRVLEGNVREIVGKMCYQDMVTNKKVFCEEVEEDVKPNLADMGIDLVTFNVQSFSDDKGLLDDLGIENTSLIKKEAAKSKAAADKEIAQAQAEADMEIAKTRANAEQATAIARANAAQKAREAEIATASAIADKQNELDIKQAKLKAQADKETAIAESVKAIQGQEQQAIINEKTADAQMVTKQKEIELHKQDVDIKEQDLAANVRKTAEANKYAEEQKALADLARRKTQAEAELYEIQKQAEAQKAQAEASKYAAEQEAAGIAAKGKAEAEAIRAKGLAEAEAIEKKAEAQAKMGDASKLEMLYNVLPSVAHELAGTLNGVDNITMYGTDAGSQFVEKTTQGLNSFVRSMTEGGLNLGSITGGIIGSKIAQNNDSNESNE